MVRFEVGRAVGDGAADFADIGFLHLHEAVVKAIRRRAEHRNIGFLGKAIDFDGVAQVSGHGLIDVHRFAGLEDRASLFEVGAAIDAFQQHDIHLLAHRFDCWINLHAVLFLKLLGIAFDPRRTRRDVGTSPFVCGDNFPTRHVVLAFLVVQKGGEGGDVGCIQPHYADA